MRDIEEHFKKFYKEHVLKWRARAEHAELQVDTLTKRNHALNAQLQRLTKANKENQDDDR